MHTNCRFLEVVNINNETEAISWSITDAVRTRRHRVYHSESGREAFREEWKKELLQESQRFRALPVPLSDFEHCAIIGGIADRLSFKFADILSGRRLRFGISQKALNMYLKHLWHFGHIVQPPHCPFDREILKALNIYDAWTKSDDQNEYMKWVNAARKMAGNLSISEWECDAWLRGRVSN